MNNPNEPSRVEVDPLATAAARARADIKRAADIAAAAARDKIRREAELAAEAIKQVARIEALEKENVGRRVTDRIAGVENAVAVHNERLDDHDKVLGAIESHLAKLSDAVGSWDRRFLVLVAVLAAGSPTGQNLISKVIG